MLTANPFKFSKILKKGQGKRPVLFSKKEVKMTNLDLLYQLHFDNSYEHVIDFADAEKQEAFFDTKVFMSLDNMTVVRENEEVKIDGNINSMIGVNYCRYTNTINGVEKTFYAFITRKEYVNPFTTRLVLEVDVYQSYMFDYDLKQSFIVREHQDRFNHTGKMLFNREPENIELGNDYEIKEKEKILDIENGDSSLVWVEVIASEPIATGSYTNTTPSTFKNFCMTANEMGVRLGLYVYLFPYKINTNTPFFTIDGTGAIVSLNTTIEDIIIKSTAVLSKRILHYCPIKYTLTAHSGGYLVKFASGYQQGVTPSVDTTKMRVVTASNSNFGGVDLSSYGGMYLNLQMIDSSNINDTLQKTFEPLSVDIEDLSITNEKSIEFEPKLKSNPYSFIQLSDNQSSPLKVYQENIHENLALNYIQAIGVQSKTKMYLSGYNSDNGKFFNSINNTISELPLLNNAYISYMASNKASATTGVALNVAMGVASLGFGIATGGIGLAVGAGGAMSVASKIANDMMKKQDLKDTPDTIRQVGNNAEFDLIDQNYLIEYAKFEIKEQFMQKAFDYFFNFGYQANCFKVPDVQSRFYFNHIHTQGVNITADLNTDIIQKLKSIYNNGVTVWHYRSAETFKGLFNYDYENLEMSIHNGGV